MESITDQMDHKRIELRQVLRDMEGISPKLSLYQKLSEKRMRLEKELAELGAKRVEPR